MSRKCLEISRSGHFETFGDIFKTFRDISSYTRYHSQLTCGDGNCVVADVSPTATQVESDLEEASSRNKMAASDKCTSEWHRFGKKGAGCEASIPRMSLVLKLFLKPMAFANTSKDLKIQRREKKLIFLLQVYLLLTYAIVLFCIILIFRF